MSSPGSTAGSGATRDFDVSTELAQRRTGMAFQRTRLSADRTPMAVIRTSLSLIAFGFTVVQFFQTLRLSEVLSKTTPARHFGEVLVWLGVAMLTIGIAYHGLFMLGLRRERQRTKAAGLLHAQSSFPASLTLITAVLLLAIGPTAIAGMAFDIGPPAN